MYICAFIAPNFRVRKISDIMNMGGTILMQSYLIGLYHYGANGEAVVRWRYIRNTIHEYAAPRALYSFRCLGPLRIELIMATVDMATTVFITKSRSPKQK